jgi:hypothetical protein
MGRSRSTLLLSLIAVLVVGSFSIALSAQRRNVSEMDVFDEMPHYSYVLSLRSGHLPRYGDVLQPNVRRIIDCVSWNAQAPCAADPAAPQKYYDSGYNYEAVQPPLGYVPYVLAATSTSSVVGDLKQVRLGGTIWIILSAMVLLAISLLEGLGPLALTGLLCLTLLNPCFTWSTGTVNNDSASLFVACACLAACVAGEKMRQRVWLKFLLFLIVGALVGLTKGVMVIAPFALFVATIVQHRPTSLRGAAFLNTIKRSSPSALMLVSCFASNLAWLAYQNSRSIVPASTLTIGTTQVLNQSFVNFSEISRGVVNFYYLFYSYLGSFRLNEVLAASVVATLIGTALYQWGPRNSGRVRGSTLAIGVGVRSLTVGILAAVVAESIFVAVVTWLQSGSTIATSTRYFEVLLPLIGLALVSLRNRWLTGGVAIALPITIGVLQLAHVTTGTFIYTSF